MNNIIEFKLKEKSKPDFKINESAVHHFIFSLSMDYITEKYGEMEALATKLESDQLFQSEVVSDRLNYVQNLTQKWQPVLENELSAQRLENEGISRIEQADIFHELFNDLLGATDSPVENLEK